MPKSYLTKQECIGLAQLTEDEERVVLTVDKRVAMVVMDREDYIQKAESLFTQPAYKTIDMNPSSKIKAKLISTLRKIKKDITLDEGTYETMYPTGYKPLSSMDYQKSIKLVTPLGLLYQAGVLLLMG